MSANPIPADDLLTEHEGIRASISYMRDLVKKQFEIAELAMTNKLSSEQIRLLEEKRVNIEQNLVSLEETLTSHYAKEEAFLRPLLGNVLKEAIKKEVDDILLRFSRVKSSIINTTFKQPSREQVLVMILNTKQSIEGLDQQVLAHATSMEGILALLERILGVKKQHSP